MWIVMTLPQHDEEVSTIHIPKLLDTILQSPPSPASIRLTEALFRATNPACWAKGTEDSQDIGGAYTRIVRQSLRLTLYPAHVLTSIRIGRTLLDVEVLPPMDCQQWKRDLLHVLQEVRAHTGALIRHPPLR